jgi:AcrR family transcriptional regulator
MTASPLRRRPRQARAQERLERILDTAEQVFAGVGYEAATTNAIAQQAETSIGSLYEFFPNKEALAQALADRYVERIGDLYNKHLVDEPATSPEALVSHIIAALDEFYREHPGAVPLLNGRLTSPQLASAGERLQEGFVAGIESIFADIARSLLGLADRVPLSQRRGVIREIEFAITGYLSATADSPPAATST